VIVKDYHQFRQIHTTRTKVEDLLQFDMDYVLDDSFVPRRNRQLKESSQQRMFEIVGKPCVENALHGYNTTVMSQALEYSGLQFLDLYTIRLPL
jgi:hypothetical protein